MQTPSAEPTDSDEFTTFMRAYQDMVYTTAARLVGNDAMAEDIAQEVFVKAHAEFGRLKDSPSVGGWLKTVATRLALNHLTRYRRRWRFFSEIESSGTDGDETAPFDVPTADLLLVTLDSEQRRIVIDRALLHLSADQRVALVLYHFEELPYEEIARRLRCSLTKVKTDIRRGRRALVSLLRDAGLDHRTLLD